MNLAVRKKFGETTKSNVQFIWRRSRRRCTESQFRFSLSDKKNLLAEIQKLKFMQEFIFAICVKCLHSNSLAKLLLHNCACVKHAKLVNVANKEFNFQEAEMLNEDDVYIIV